MDGIEIIKRMKEIIKYIKMGDDQKAILYMHYIMEDIELYKKNSL